MLALCVCVCQMLRCKAILLRLGGPSIGRFLERRLSQEAGPRTAFFLVMLPKECLAKVKAALFSLYQVETPESGTIYNPNLFDGLGCNMRVGDRFRYVLV